MICALCEEKGLKSKVVLDCCSSYDENDYFSGGKYGRWAIGEQYYDTDGKFHNHHLARFWVGGCCSNGHNIMIRESTKCPSCDDGEGVVIKFYEPAPSEDIGRW